ncbi:MAG: MCE family protein [Opitutaceae bacterium]|nr:MCE family protein [Opitutaceae bacterium]
MNNFQQTARVGLFFILGLALTWVTFETLRGGKVFKDQGYNLIAGFESLKELKEGDEVRMAGVKIGEVEKTRLAGRRAEAVLRISHQVKIKSDASAMIVMAGLIGTNYLSVTLGTEAAPDLPDGAEITTKTTPDLNSVMTQMGELGKKLETAIGDLSSALSGDGKNETGIIKKVDQLITENRENISKATANLQEITTKVNKGEGTLGRLISDPKMYDELVSTIAEIKNGASEAKTFIANAQKIVDQVKSGQGAIGALVFDQKAGDDIKVSIANLRSVSEKIARGEGSLGKLLSDESLFRDAQSIMKKADRALDGLDDTGPITAVGVVYGGLF